MTERTSGFHAVEYEKLIEMTSDIEVKTKFEKLPLDVFWGYINKEYPDISKQAIKILLHFATAYLCEPGFSRYISTKIKYQSKNDAAPDMRIQLSFIKPDFQCIMSKEQKHHSHQEYADELFH